ncbi:MAG: GDP-mannose 4,6-dehydratase, partial [Bacteroidetes bacterium]|nr:GDP-mannose 4,6-dehydratase [Bacteroidota bacterium]
MNILVTGGAGFIGSNFIRMMIKKYPNYFVLNVDKLTYAGNLENLSDIQSFPNYAFERIDICDR